MGESVSEVIRNSGIRSFERWLAQSPFTVKDLSVERGIYFSGIIEENKDKEYSKIMFLHVANDIPLLVGDIMNWRVEHGDTEKWIIFKEEKKVNGTYRTFWIIRCNYLIKWIDAAGILQDSWSYIVSSKDDKIKGNFRTWNNLITPQPNKYAEIMMPRRAVDRSTNFIVEDESWKVIEYDHTSVPGIIYLSLTENKINMIYDDLKNNVADTDRLKFPELAAMWSIGDIITPTFVDENFSKLDYTMVSSNLEVVNENMEAVGAGTTTITIALKDRPTILKQYELIVREAAEEFSAYINGADTIRLDRQEAYQLVGTTDISNENVTFHIPSEDEEYVQMLTKAALAPEDREKPNFCVLHANKKNKLGTITLIAEYNGQQYTKAIKIIPLW